MPTEVPAGSAGPSCRSTAPKLPVRRRAGPERFDRLVRASGLPRLTLHGLRHSHCSLALQAGVHPKVVQERVGHSSVAFTLDRYSHAVPAMHEDAARMVARLVGLD